jgi:phenylpropionate dioxygenase-like ring-hydroxylating dioxygenase large terminal subunit
MRHETQVSLIERMLELVERGEQSMLAEDWQIPVSRYFDEGRFALERDRVIRRQPIIVAHSAELPNAGDFVTEDFLGVPIVVVRDQDGLRAFVNVCRHRGARIVGEPRGERRKAFVCPYHGWTYDLAGTLVHIPQAQGFPSCDPRRSGLVPLAVQERHGLVWVVPTPGAALSIDAFLGPLADDLAAFGLERHVVPRKVVDRKRTNWKLIMEAFLEGYHLRTLHRDTIYRFFMDNCGLIEAFPPHVRAAGARRNLRDSLKKPRDQWDVREVLTVFYAIYPNTLIVFHPDWASLMTLIPEGPEETTYIHRMLIPAPPRTEEEERHWAQTFALIEGGVFQKEDLATAEGIQRGMRSGANQVLTVGRFESGIRFFHEALSRTIAGEPTPGVELPPA